MQTVPDLYENFICIVWNLYTLTISPFTAWAADVSSSAAPKRADPTLEQRLADLEAYVNNGARVADNTNNVSSKLGSYNDKTGEFHPGPGPGHNAWQMTSAALVLFMTLPGLALFYGGLVRRKNVLSVMAQCFFITGMVTILWWLCGYSLVFHQRQRRSSASLDFAFLNGVDSSPNADYSLLGFAKCFRHVSIDVRHHHAGADRRRHRRAHEILGHLPLHDALDVRRLFPAWRTWSGASTASWTASATPTAEIKAIDFAGGTVVHMTSGWSALILCLILGKRAGLRQGTTWRRTAWCCAWSAPACSGWAGMASTPAARVAADVIAANAFTTTTLATAVASFVWPMAEWITARQAQRAGLLLRRGGRAGGHHAGLRICHRQRRGDHRRRRRAGSRGSSATRSRAGSAMTTRSTPSASTPSAERWARCSPACWRATAPTRNLATNLKDYVTSHFLQPLVWEQIKAIGVTLVLAVVGTMVIAYIVKAVVGLRPSEEVEIAGSGLDGTWRGRLPRHGARYFADIAPARPGGGSRRAAAWLKNKNGKTE